MDAREYEVMAALQERHWWFRTKRRVVSALLRRVLAKPPEGSPGGRLDRLLSLDAGCGTGSMASVLPGRRIGVDAHAAALRHVRGETVAAANLLALPFADALFDVVGCFDVLYHRRVADLPHALSELARVCRPGGVLLVTDSAGPKLMGPHDVAYHGARRFELGDLELQIRTAGFQVLHGSYFHSVLYPVAAPLRLAARRRAGVSSHNDPTRGERAGRSDLGALPAALNAALEVVGRLEAAVAPRVRLPFGLSVLVAARREGIRAGS